MNRILEYVLKIVKNEFSKIEDFRQIAKIGYKIPAVLLDNLQLFLLQYSSFRQFKRSYSQVQGVIKEERIKIGSSQKKQ